MAQLTLDDILYRSCYNHYYEPDFDWSTWDGKWTPEWKEFEIDTHCLRFKIIAKLNEDGKTYTIRSHELEDC